MAKNPDQDPISVSSVSEGFEPFAVADLWRQSETDILYIASDGVVLEQNADILQALLPQTEILRFPAWDTVPYDRVSPNVNISPGVPIRSENLILQRKQNVRGSLPPVSARFCRNCRRSGYSLTQ